MNLSSIWDTWIAKPVSEIQSELQRHGIRVDDVFEKSELVSRLVDYFFPASQNQHKSPSHPRRWHFSTTHSAPQNRRPSTTTAETVTMDQLTSEDEVDGLSVVQLKHLLSSHQIDFTRMIERSELVSEVKRLWRLKHRPTKTKTSNSNTASGATSNSNGMTGDLQSDDRSCCICMNAEINSAFVRCGHMITCYACGKDLRECPVCRQPVEFTMRVYPS